MCSSDLALVPILGTLFAIPLLGEHPTELQIAGMILASTGMVIAVIRSALVAKPAT